MLKVSRWVIRLLKCLICILTGGYRENDGDYGYAGKHGHSKDRHEQEIMTDRKEDKEWEE